MKKTELFLWFGVLIAWVVSALLFSVETSQVQEFYSTSSSRVSHIFSSFHKQFFVKLILVIWRRNFVWWGNCFENISRDVRPVHLDLENDLIQSLYFFSKMQENTSVGWSSRCKFFWNVLDQTLVISSWAIYKLTTIFTHNDSFFPPGPFWVSFVN